MEGNKGLGGFGILVVAFLAFPIVASKIRAQNGIALTPATSTTSPVPAVSTDPKALYPELNQPPLLNEGNLIGSEWQVQVEQYKVKDSLAERILNIL